MNGVEEYAGFDEKRHCAFGDWIQIENSVR
jgi:hypothetical protein